MTRRLCTAFASLLLTVTLAACGGDSPAETTAPEVHETTATPVETLPPFADADGATWRIVRPEEASEGEIDAAVMLTKKMLATVGVMPELTTDFIKPGASYDSNTYEILIGRTAHPEVTETLAVMTPGQYTVRAVGRKLVVTAWSDNGVALAVSALCDMLDAGMTTYTPDRDATASFNDMLDALPAYTDGKFGALANAGNRAYQLVCEKTTAEAWEAYGRQIEAAGFVLSSSREVEGNRFAVYRGESYGITTYFTPFNKTARTIIEPVANLGPVGDDAGTKQCEPMMTMIGRRYSSGNTYRGMAADTGYMCYVLRLEDGRFIVIDGGTESGNFSGTIYRMLTEQAPDPQNITIAAWIITHTHGDHTGGFMAFCRSYSSRIKIEQLITNLPADSETNAYSADAATAKPSKVIAAYTTAYPAGQVVKAHNGYTRNIGGAQIEVLYTHEDFLTSGRSLASFTKHGWNKTSLIFRVTLGGETIMFLGDAQEENNNIVCSMYGDYLASNIVQVAHHGGEGGTALVYTKINPKVALFTTSDELMPVYLGDAHNAHLVNKLSLAEWINAADRITQFTLPYTPGTAKIIAG